MGGIMFDHMTPLVHITLYIEDLLTTNSYVTQSVEAVVPPLLKGLPTKYFNKTMPGRIFHGELLTARLDFASFPGKKLSRSTPESIVHFTVCGINRRPLAQTMDDLRTTVDVA
ncbi:hypothetical protein TNCV_4377771 [Trichonephila clavipes]|nr:hypothetical protein TNCV_4377771 [Trichonephila clavipes]